MLKKGTGYLKCLALLLTAVFLVAALSLPAVAAAPQNARGNIQNNAQGKNQGNAQGAVQAAKKGGKKGPGDNPGDTKGTCIKGTASGSLSISNENETVELSMPDDTVEVNYSVTDTTYTLRSLRVVRTSTDRSAMDGNRIQGTVSGSVTISPSSGDPLTFSLPATAMEAIYTVSNDLNVLKCLTPAIDKPDPQIPQADNITHARGTVSGTITVANDNSTITISMATGTVDIDYSEADSVYTLKSLRLIGEKADPPAISNLKNCQMIHGTASGSIIFTSTEGVTITLNMPAERINVAYNTIDGVNQVINLGKCHPGNLKRPDR